MAPLGSEAASVDRDFAGAQLTCNAPRALHVGGPDAGGKPVVRVVGDRNRAANVCIGRPAGTTTTTEAVFVSGPKSVPIRYRLSD
jgi:hypothetical protein